MGLGLGDLDFDREVRVVLGLLDPEVSGAGFDWLGVAVVLGEATLYDLSFTDVAAAVAFFDDRTLGLGPLPLSDLAGERLSVSFSMDVSRSGDGFALSALVLTTPEPSTGLLLALGLLVIGARRTRRPVGR